MLTSRRSFLLAALALASVARAQVVPTDGMVITIDTTFAAGTYSLPNGITVGASGITVDGNGATIVGGITGSGVFATGRNNVTIRNLNVRGYFHGMHFYDCDDLVVEDCAALETPALPEGSIFLNIFDGPTGTYAHAVWLRSCARPTIRRNDVSGQQNGISLFNCDAATVEDNYASFNTGWGIYFYDSDNSTVQRNTADYCTRDYFGISGADAASILIVYNSDHNEVLDNSFVGGGDGVFLAGATHSLQSRPCNFNHFARNDCSDSPNNGFEATFSQGNVFEDNISDRCNYGYWLGYAHDTIVRNNQANACATAGVAIEHGRNNIIEGNTLADNGRGIYLWTDNDANLVSAFPLAKDSHGYEILRNALTGNSFGLLCEAHDSNRFSYDYSVTSNSFSDNGYAVRFLRTSNSTLASNTVIDSNLRGIQLEQSSANSIYNNRLENASNVWDDGTNTWSTPKTPGVNIVGGPYLGGNYWSDYTGVDTTADGLGDTELPYNAGGDIANGGDSLPLTTGADTDADGLADEWETLHFGDLSAGPADDPDGDDLTNLEEFISHTNPLLADTDDDGLEDGDEVNVHGTNPANADSDADGLADGDEIALGTDPNNPDHDGDGLPDGWEVDHGLDPLVDDAASDSDGDGLTAVEEYNAGSDPEQVDTDSDGVDDGVEVAALSAPDDPLSFPVAWDVLPSDPCYFPYTDVSTPPSPDYWPRANISVAAANGSIYSVGGYGPQDYASGGRTYYANRQSGFGIFDLPSGTWSAARWDGTGPTGYNNGNGSAGAVVDQGTYTGGNQVFTYDRDGDGTDELFVLAGYPIWDGVFAVYDPDTDEWSNSAARPFGGLMAAYHATALEWNGSAYVYGGQFNGPDGNGLFVYDISSDTWVQLANGPVRLKQHCGEIVGDKMYLISGQQDGVDYGTAVVQYDLASGAWDTSSSTPIPSGVNRAASVLIDGRIHVVGGATAAGSSAAVQVYDPSANTWHFTAPLPSPRSRHGAVMVSNKLYVVGGHGPGAAGEENKCDLWSLDLAKVNLPRARVDAPGPPTRGEVAVAYRLYDVNGSLCSVAVEYSVGGSNWQPASPSADGDGTTNLTTAPTGREHVFVWDTRGDLGYGIHTNVRIRVTPNDPETGTAGTTEMFEVVNALGDFNLDGVIDLVDFGSYQRCFGSVAVGDCAAADFDGSGAITEGDTLLFVQALTGP